jgi:hypothetical protein
MRGQHEVLTICNRGTGGNSLTPANTEQKRSFDTDEPELDAQVQVNPLTQRFPNFFQVGTTFISQNVLRSPLLLSPLKANCLRFLTTVCDTQFTLILFFYLFWTNVQSKRTTRAEPEDHLWSADHSLGNATLTVMGHSGK